MMRRDTALGHWVFDPDYGDIFVDYTPEELAAKQSNEQAAAASSAASPDTAQQIVNWLNTNGIDVSSATAPQLTAARAAIGLPAVQAPQVSATSGGQIRPDEQRAQYIWTPDSFFPGEGETQGGTWANVATGATQRGTADAPPGDVLKAVGAINSEPLGLWGAVYQDAQGNFYGTKHGSGAPVPLTGNRADGQPWTPQNIAAEMGGTATAAAQARAHDAKRGFLGDLGPIAQLAALIPGPQQPFVMGLNAANSVDQGNYLAALANAVGAGMSSGVIPNPVSGAFGNTTTTGINPGITTLPDGTVTSAADQAAGMVPEFGTNAAYTGSVLPGAFNVSVDPAAQVMNGSGTGVTGALSGFGGKPMDWNSIIDQYYGPSDPIFGAPDAIQQSINSIGADVPLTAAPANTGVPWLDNYLNGQTVNLANSTGTVPVSGIVPGAGEGFWEEGMSGGAPAGATGGAGALAGTPYSGILDKITALAKQVGTSPASLAKSLLGGSAGKVYNPLTGTLEDAAAGGGAGGGGMNGLVLPLLLASILADRNKSSTETTTYAPDIQTGIDAALAAASRVGPAFKPFDPSTINQYINPYVKGALDPAALEVNRTFDQIQQKNDALAGVKGAFGEDRALVERGLNNEGRGKAIGSLYGKGYADAYDKAQNVAYNETQAERALPLNEVTAYRGALSAVGKPPNTVTKTAAPPSTLGQITGAIGAANTIGGITGTNPFSNVLSWFNSPSTATP